MGCATVLLRQRFALLWQRRRERSRHLQVTGTLLAREEMVCAALCLVDSPPSPLICCYTKNVRIRVMLQCCYSPARPIGLDGRGLA